MIARLPGLDSPIVKMAFDGRAVVMETEAGHTISLPIEPKHAHEMIAAFNSQRLPPLDLATFCFSFRPFKRTVN